MAALVRLGRPKFLLYSMLYITLGSAVAVFDGSALSPACLLHCLAYVWAVHLMTHCWNDYYDLEADRKNAAPTPWTGGSRVLIENLLPPRAAVWAALVLLALALALWLGFANLLQRAVSLLMIVLAYFYTAPPVRLNYRGFGEVTVAIVLTLLTPLLAFLVERPGPFSHLLLITAPLALLQASRMLCMNLADYEGDLRAGKRTLAVRLGRVQAAHLFVFGQLLSYVTTIAAMVAGLPLAAGLGILCSAPLGLLVALLVRRMPVLGQDGVTRCVFLASTQIAVAALLTTLGLLAQFLYQRVEQGFYVDARLISAGFLLGPLGLYLYFFQRQLHLSRGAKGT